MATLNHFSYRYSGTYVSINSDGVRYPVQVRDSDDDDNVELKEFNEQQKEYRIINRDIADLDLSLPKLGMVQVGKSAVYVTRNVLRRYKRGLDVENLSTFFPHNVGGYGYVTLTDYETIKAVYNPVYTGIVEAEELLRSGKALAKAVSINLCLGISSFANDPILYYTNMEVGYVRDGEIILHPTYDFVGMELDDLDAKYEVWNV